MSHIALSRLAITGKLNESTPIIVLQEIADAHGISYNINYFSDESYIRQTIQEIHRHKVVTVQPPYTTEHYRYIARFINPKSSWHIQTLNIAFLFIQRYMGEYYEIPLELDQLGPQTPEHPQSLNACILYKLCRYYQINTYPHMTLEDMAIAIRLLSQPISILTDILNSHMETYSKSTLINMLISSNNCMDRKPLIEFFPHYTVPSDNPEEVTSESLVDDSEFTHEDLDASFHNLREAVSRWNRIQPKTKAEAIVLAALNYKIDISGSQNPLLEYSLLQNPPYIPADPSLRSKIQILGRDALRLDHHFNPMLPPSCYIEDDLRAMAIREGYLPSDLSFSNPYELLSIAYVSNTFHAGPQDGMLNTETPFSLDLVHELDPHVIVCYGSKAATREMGLIAFRYAELAEQFHHAKNFTNPMRTTYPHTGEIFEALAIRKLKFIVNTAPSGESQEAMLERQQLAQAILEVELFNDSNTQQYRAFYQVYLSADISTKEAIRDAIIALFELSMFMRGWDGHGNYPIREAPVDNQEEVDIRVSQGISRFEEKCLHLNEIGNIILNLPLLQYRGGIFSASTDVSQGRTIEERIQIVRQGDNTSNTNSCIRLSSNWLAASAYRYMQIIGLSPPFDIELLRNIS